MTSELKCPFCGGEFDIISIKRKMLGCPTCLHIADGAFWKKAIQAKQDLEIATKALKEITTGEMGCKCSWCGRYEIADKALEQIDHIADVSKMV